jgi:DNA-binding beta-propeller fold protein YncE
MRLVRIASLFAVTLVLVAISGAQSAPTYKVRREIKLGGEGGWDYLTFDAPTCRLFIARATRVMVVDVDSGKLLGEIPGTPGVHGVALVPKLGRGVSSNGRDDSATIFDLKSLKPIATVKTGGKPDAILFDERSGHVLTFNGRTNNVTIIDPEKAVAIGTIDLPGRPETGVSDNQGKIFVNLEDKNMVAVIDLDAKKVLNTWNLEGCVEPTGLSIDRKNRRLFSGCHNGVLVAMNADSGQNVARLPIGRNVDATAFDPEKQLIFSSNGEGTISVIRQDSPTQYSSLENVTTWPGARTMALDLDRHAIYTVANLGSTPDKKNPGEFGILVVDAN